MQGAGTSLTNLKRAVAAQRAAVDFRHKGVDLAIMMDCTGSMVSGASGTCIYCTVQTHMECNPGKYYLQIAPFAQWHARMRNTGAPTFVHMRAAAAPHCSLSQYKEHAWGC